MRSIRWAERTLANGSPSPARNASTTFRKLRLSRRGEFGTKVAMKKPSLAIHARRAAKEGSQIIAERGQKPEHRFGTAEISKNLLACQWTFCAHA